MAAYSFQNAKKNKKISLKISHADNRKSGYCIHAMLQKLYLQHCKQSFIEYHKRIPTVAAE